MKRHILLLTSLDSLLTHETCASTTSAFFLSHDIRRDVRFYVASEHFTIILDGSTIRLLRPDAQSSRGLLRKALQAQSSGETRRLPRGFSLSPSNVGMFLKRLPNSILTYPSQRGRKLAELKFQGHDPALIVGSDSGKVLGLARDAEAVPVRLSRWPLPSNQEIALFNIQLDRMGLIDGDSAGSRHSSI